MKRVEVKFVYEFEADNPKELLQHVSAAIVNDVEAFREGKRQCPFDAKISIK